MAKLFVNNKDESPRMFKSDFLDMFSRVHWSVPLIFWGPAVIFCIYYSAFVYALPILWMVVSFFGALLLWSFAEYILHRFVFHYYPSSKIGQRIHFIAHGVHHDFPNDSKRLVMPPALSIPLAVVFFTLFTLIFGQYNMICFAGFTTGYLIYDLMHYALHHAGWKNAYFRRLKEYHMMHHYHDPDNGYGVSSPFWDVIFGSKFTFEKTTKSTGDHAGE